MLTTARTDLFSCCCCCLSSSCRSASSSVEASATTWTAARWCSPRRCSPKFRTRWCRTWRSSASSRVLLVTRTSLGRTSPLQSAAVCADETYHRSVSGSGKRRTKYTSAGGKCNSWKKRRSKREGQTDFLSPTYSCPSFLSPAFAGSAICSATLYLAKLILQCWFCFCCFCLCSFASDSVGREKVVKRGYVPGYRLFTLCLQCFDAVGWVTERASGL